MENKHRGELSFDADGKHFVLVYSTNALVELEDELDRGIVDIMNEIASWQQDASKIRLSTIRAILWAGLRERQPETDLQTAGELIPKVGGILSVVTMIAEGLMRAFPAPEMKGPRPPKGAKRTAAAPGTGLNS
jgi:hypothetical protein